eukprot:CAMPEP_0181231984 /NCGR_PEP_ID=MMETSP1096-20121128/35442_1 /TAXON_ID=156174 ORGANISM="Chrysochromulina ericina, Strain CCMP281" /NCGR_SAMPLE_ID=MMETSP1096 /ASSEMBLY_ACC=CAM_ASM_000453 /LENGTH=30 /DNA_ID= /DNA_START= /DNA_END= /DNA_ORIENTATION=
MKLNSAGVVQWVKSIGQGLASALPAASNSC